MHELRSAWRAIIGSPVVSAVVVLSLGAGIGVNTVVFSWVQARLLEPIPGVEGGASVQLIEPKSDAGLYSGSSWPEFLDMRRELGSFDDVFAARMVPAYVGEPGAVERVFGLLVSDNYFSALDVRPAIGRFFRPDEVSQPGREPVVVVSHRLWEATLGATTDLGSVRLRVNGLPLSVIGVAPPAFQGTTLGLQFDIYVPATLAAEIASGSNEIVSRQVRGYGVMARLGDGVRREAAQAEVDALMARLASDYPSTNQTMVAEVLPFSLSPRGPQRMLNTALTILQAVMLLLLLAVCGNIANLMLARASARRREMGIRLALGSSPRRLVRLLVAESLLLGLCGAVLGAVMAVWGTRGLLMLPMTGLPIRFETRIDGLGFLFALALGVVSAVLAVAGPALHTARIDPLSVLRVGAGGGGRSPLRQFLMSVQVALAITVLIVAGLFFQSFMETRREDPGFVREGVVLVAYDLSGRAATASDTRQLATRILDGVGRLPGVESVAVAVSVPLDIHGLSPRVVNVEGHARDDGGFDEALSNIVTPGYFDVMQIPMLAGRDFAPLSDTSAPRQVIVNEEFVARYIAPREPLGRRVIARGGEYVIQGVVRNSLLNAFGEPPTPAIYFSYRDTPVSRGDIHVRTTARDVLSVSGEIRRVMRDIDPDLPAFNVRSLTEHVETNLLFRRIPARMFAVLGPLLLALAAIGVYAVVAYAVSLRTQEIGVRLALGAPVPRVIWRLIQDSLLAAVLGATLGWAAALVVAGDVLTEDGIDWAVFGVVPVLLLGVVGVASWVPARRATGMNPTSALRSDAR